MDVTNTRNNLDALMKKYEKDKKREAAKPKQQKPVEKPELSPMTELKNALWDRFMNPYAKYGL